MTEHKRPYIDITCWIKTLWDAINELRNGAEESQREIHNHAESIARLEAAIGPGMYDEYADGSEEAWFGLNKVRNLLAEHQRSSMNKDDNDD